MNHPVANDDELKRREKAALDAIKHAFGATDDEYGVTLFVSHHLDEIEESYWVTHLKTAIPEPRHVLDILELKSCWSNEHENAFDTFDFTLPEGITNYLICVRFDVSGKVKEIFMES
ncbi:MAG: DUF2004 domain-containing protein [Alphaproteobacteria bacterium]|nr:DUF2004 domain-containing protein [Alphaproteobacteria bacterium]